MLFFLWMVPMGNITTKEFAPPASMIDEVLADFKVDSSDILIPKILLMQPSSEMVADGKATIGDFRNSVSGEKHGTIVDPFLFVPFHFVKKWDILDADANNKWVESKPFLPGDESLPWEFTELGKKFKRVKRIDMFGFIPGEVSVGNILPMTLSFKSTGYREGTKILTQFILNINKKKLPWANMYSISGEKKKNDDNQTYCIPKVDLAGEAAPEFLELCMQWYKNIKQSLVKVTVDDSDVAKEVATELVNETAQF